MNTSLRRIDWTPKVVHVTELQSFMSCRRKWYYRHVLELDTLLRPNHLWFGIVMHEALANYYTNKNKHLYEYFCQSFENKKEDWWQEDYSEKVDEFEKLGTAMSLQYVAFAQKADEKLTPKFIEKRLTYDVNGVEFAGTLDIVHNVEGSPRPVIHDHKTYARMFSAEEMSFESQATDYPFLYWKNFDIVPLFDYNILRKKIPATPQILQSGGLSKAKNIDTTYEVYRNAILSLELDPDDYTDILEKLKYNNFNMRVPIHFTVHQLKAREQSLQMQVEDMYNPLIYPCRKKECVNSCKFYQLCCAEEHGNNMDEIIDAIYIHKPVEYGSVVTEGETE